MRERQTAQDRSERERQATDRSEREPPPVRLNPTAAALLGLLGTEQHSGYELHQIAGTVFGDYWTITRSQVYRELASMERLRLVDAGAQGARSRRPYAVTPTGRAAFADWVVQEPGPEVIRFPLLMTINFGDWIGRERLLQFVEAQRPVHEERLAHYREGAAATQEHGLPLAGATVAFGLHYEQAVLAWMDEIPALLASVPDGPTEAAGPPT